MPLTFKQVQAANDRLGAQVSKLEMENDRMRAAPAVCAADYISAPCTVIEGHSMLSVEFRRRMEVAHAALV